MASDFVLTRVPTIADLVAATEIMTRELTCARRDLSVDGVITLMVRHHIGCVPVVDDLGKPIGMITKFDVVEQVIAAKQEGDSPTPEALAPKTAEELMMPLAIVLGERATIAHAAALMASEDVHHVPIVDGAGRIIGVVSTMDIVRWLAHNDGFVNSP